MQSAVSLTHGSRMRYLIIAGSLIIPALLLSLAAPAQSLSRRIEAKLSGAQIVTAVEESPRVSADLTIIVISDFSGRRQRIQGRLDLHGLTINADRPASGWFTISDDDDDRLFTGRWFATTCRDGATLISLEGLGYAQFTRHRLKLRIRARGDDGAAVYALDGEGTGEIR